MVGFTFVQKFYGFCRQAFGEVFFFVILFQVGILPGTVVAAGRRTDVESADVDVETLVGGEIAFAAHVPFARKEGLITRVVQHLGNGDFIQCQFICVFDLEEAGVIGLGGFHAGNPIGDVHSHGMASGQDTSAGGRAYRARRVTSREFHA